MRILIAEDNAVNQKLALLMLQRMGYRADVANNGIEAIESLQRQPYDLILMDMQMPDMDGLDATRQIRREWPLAQQPRIIAMTANAMQGDREACLAAGMDDYISKPVQVPELHAALERWGQRATGKRRTQTHTVIQLVRPDQSVLDTQVLANLRDIQIEGEPSVLNQLAALFAQESPGLIAAMRQAVADGDADALRSAAHNLKGSSNNLGAKRLGTLCASLEKIARSGSTQIDSLLLDELEQEYEKACLALEREQFKS